MEIVTTKVVGNSQDSQIVEKKKEYMEYLNQHIRNVNFAFQEYFIPLLNKEINATKFSVEDLYHAIRNVSSQIGEHDASKYEDTEFNGYRMNFHPTNTEKGMGDEFQEYVNQEFQKSWEHHYSNNPHHPLFWVDKDSGEISDMSMPAIVEMICDWISMSKYFHSSTREWYTNDAEKEKSQMTGNTKDIVEELLFHVLEGPEL